jgi:MoaA/NifB/PqqE/SkfB family radical SAM enzyme
MYCPAELHDKTSRHRDLETLQKTWHEILAKTQHLDLPYKISFTGGEVTTNRNFLPLVEYIRSMTPDSLIFMTTNGSASLKYYLRIAQTVNGISFSTHSEFMDEKKFFTTVRELNKVMVRPEKSLHVNIMDEYWNQDRNTLYENFCKDHSITYSVNNIDYSRQTRTHTLRQGKYNIDKI